MKTLRALAWALLAMPGLAEAATFAVDSTVDAVDAAPGDGLCATADGACTLRAAVMEACVGSVVDSDDNALAESVIGLCKSEVVERLGLWRGVEAVELATLGWVDCFNARRLLAPLGHLPPAGYEAMYDRRQGVPAMGAGRT